MDPSPRGSQALPFAVHQGHDYLVPGGWGHLVVHLKGPLMPSPARSSLPSLLLSCGMSLEGDVGYGPQRRTGVGVGDSIQETIW